MTASTTTTDWDAILRPERLWTGAEVLARPCPVPAEPGVYGWYFDPAPRLVPTAGCHRQSEGVLLYVGISPKAPPRDGGRPSRQCLRHRLRYHYRGNAEGSTLRLTLGCLLSQELDLELRRAGSGRRLTFGRDGEAALSAWMLNHARVTWVSHPHPWLLEEDLIRSLDVPLNLDQNRHNTFHQELSGLRSTFRARARDLPVRPN